MPGLLSCKDFQQYYCIIKLIEVLLAGLLGVFCMSEIVISFKMQGRFSMNTRLAILILMFLSLVFDFAHELIAQQQIKILLYLDLYFANNFFLTIFYYVGDNVVKGRKSRIALHVFYIGLILFYTAILLLRSIQQTKRLQCSQRWYIMVDGLTIIVSILILILYCKKSMDEQKMQQFYSENLVNSSPYQSTSFSSFNSPFTRMWILISVNIFCGIMNLVQTLILTLGFEGTCRFSQDINMNTLIHFVFKMFSYYLGSFVTLLVLRRIRVIIMESENNVWHSIKQGVSHSQSYSIDANEGNKLELIAQRSNRSSSY